MALRCTTGEAVKGVTRSGGSGSLATPTAWTFPASADAKADASVVALSRTFVCERDFFPRDDGLHTVLGSWHCGGQTRRRQRQGPRLVSIC